MGAEVRVDFANQVRRRLPAAGDKWHLDEAVLTIAGVKHWRWCAVDQTASRLRRTGVLDILVQSQRDAWAAKHLLRKPKKAENSGLNWSPALMCME